MTLQKKCKPIQIFIPALKIMQISSDIVYFIDYLHLIFASIPVITAQNNIFYTSL